MLQYVDRHVAVLELWRTSIKKAACELLVVCRQTVANAKHVSYLQAIAVLGYYAAYVVVVYQRFGTTHQAHLQKSNFSN
jgi:Ca2+/Na+ antiporter